MVQASCVARTASVARIKALSDVQRSNGIRCRNGAKACIFKLLITAGNAPPRFPDGRARHPTMARRVPFVESKLTIFSGGLPHFWDPGPIAAAAAICNVAAGEE